jgi:protein phosphatase 2C
VPVRLLASRRDLDGLGLDADALRLPAHLFRSGSASRGEGRR